MWSRQTRLAPRLARAIARASIALVLAAGSLLAALVGVPAVGAASPRCTDWSSSVNPPETIWVELHQRSTRGAPPGTRVQVDFKTYVERVVTLEWGPGEVSRAQLMSAALVVKQYAWWYVMHPSAERRDRNGDCFDIGSTTKYQLYRESATASPGRTALIRSAIEATWSTSVWKTSGRRKGPAHTGYRAGAYAEGCIPRTTGFHLYQQNARKCARLGETAEAIIRRYYGPNIALYEPRAMTIGGLPVGSLWRVTPDRRLWSGEDAQPWVSHGRLLPEPGPGESSLGVAVIDEARTSDRRAGYELVEARLGADGGIALTRLRPEVALVADAPDDPLATPWPVPSGWFAAGDRLLLVPGDFDGDLRAELGLLRLRDREGTVSAELAVAEPLADGWTWRGSVWVIADLAARGIDPWSLAVEGGDVNGDGVDDLALLTPTPASDPHAATHPTSLYLASSIGQRWDLETGSYADALLGEPVRIDLLPEPLERSRLFALDRDADGSDEIVIALADMSGALRLELVRFPSRSSEPRCADEPVLRCHSLWMRADPSLGAIDLASLSLETVGAGIGRDDDGYREPRTVLLISGRFVAEGERIYAVDPRGELPADDLTPTLNLLPLSADALDR